MAVDPPSGDALDRAAKFVADHGLRPGLMAELIEDIAKLIDRADAAPAVMTQVKSLEEYLPDAIGRVESNDRTRTRHETAALHLLQERPAVGLLTSALAEIEWFNWRCDGQRVDLNSMQAKLDIADRQRREFKGHADRAHEERDAAQAAMREAVRGRLGIATIDQLLEELRRRLTS